MFNDIIDYWCYNCSHEFDIRDHNYCPNCGIDLFNERLKRNLNKYIKNE